MSEKICSSCNLSLPLDAFSSHWDNRFNKRYPSSKCRNCENAYTREYKRRKKREAGKPEYVPATERPLKRCYICKKEFPRTTEFFHANKANHDGLVSSCKVCTRLKVSAHQRAMPADKIRERNKQWRKNTVNGRRYQRRHLDKRYALTRGSTTAELIDRQTVWQRDKGVCHICNLPCDIQAWQLDHIIPVSRGGPHTYDNVAVSHAECNNRKRDKLSSALGDLDISPVSA